MRVTTLGRQQKIETTYKVMKRSLEVFLVGAKLKMCSLCWFI